MRIDDLVVLLAAAGVAIAAGVFFTSRKNAAPAALVSNSAVGWLGKSDGQTTAAARWASIPDPRSDYAVIFTSGMDTSGNVITVGQANAEGGFQ